MLVPQERAQDGIQGSAAGTDARAVDGGRLAAGLAALCREPAVALGGRVVCRIEVEDFRVPGLAEEVEEAPRLRLRIGHEPLVAQLEDSAARPGDR